MALDTQKIIDDLKDASILELNDLIKAIEEEFDVKAAAQLLLAAAGADAAAEKMHSMLNLQKLDKKRLRLSRKFVVSLDLA